MRLGGTSIGADTQDWTALTAGARVTIFNPNTQQAQVATVMGPASTSASTGVATYPMMLADGTQGNVPAAFITSVLTPGQINAPVSDPNVSRWVQLMDTPMSEWQLTPEEKTRAWIWGALSTVSMAAGAYHGYKRNSSVGWALWWGAMGAMFPVITPTIAVAQGFGKKSGG
jgi:hypothetical protein